MAQARKTTLLNCPPVLALWTAIVAERLGPEREEALSPAKAVAGINAQSKERRLGIFKPGEESAEQTRKKAKRGEELFIGLPGRRVRAKNTNNGSRAVTGDRTTQHRSVERYLENTSGDDLNTDVPAGHPRREARLGRLG
jgi:hypothetical protein